MDKVSFIALVRYLGWVCYQMGAGLPIHNNTDGLYPPSEDRLESLKIGTEWALSNPSATAEDNHKCWMETKLKQGWKYGEVLDTVLKTHPDIVDYHNLTEVEKRKDDMDILMVRLAARLYEDIQKSGGLT